MAEVARKNKELEKNEKPEGNEELEQFVQEISTKYTDFRFREGRKFAFRPPRTIIYTKVQGKLTLNEYKMSILHELGHALLEHRDFRTDTERVKMECLAWEKARELSEECGVKFDEEFSEGELDSYRDWLHRRSLCPKCRLTRFQTRDGEYHCPGCEY